jgi:hypothetical protein
LTGCVRHRPHGGRGTAEHSHVNILEA